MRKGTGVIKEILKDHFAGFWEFHSDRFPESYRNHIKATVEKTIRCGTRDLGYAQYGCLGYEGKSLPKFVCLLVKVGCVTVVAKSIQTTGRTNNRK